MTHMLTFPGPDDGHEPARDERLGRLLRSVVGDAPADDVDWVALADRISAAVRARRAAPWWSHVERWQRRALPLALAAGLVGGVALWSAAVDARADATSASGSVDLVSAVVSGVSSEDAAMSYAGAVAGSIDLVAEAPQ